MPCYDGGPDCRNDYHTEMVAEKLAKELSNAMLCAVLSVIEDHVGVKSILDKIDYEEAGFRRRQLERWWTRHQIEDVQRRTREKAARDKAAKAKAKAELKEQLKKAALAKLSPEEREALGVK